MSAVASAKDGGTMPSQAITRPDDTFLWKQKRRGRAEPRKFTKKFKILSCGKFDKMEYTVIMMFKLILLTPVSLFLLRYRLFL